SRDEDRCTTSMHIADFDYDLPAEQIAQTPAEPRDSSRLLVVHRNTGKLEHRSFREIGGYLQAGDLLIANQSRVIPARLRGVKEGTGGQVELLLLAARGDLGFDTWEALVRPGRRVHDGQQLLFGEGALVAEVLTRTPSGGRVVRLRARDGDVAGAVGGGGGRALPPPTPVPPADSERDPTGY